MGIDHGLGGKDNVKSKQRREKKAKKTKVIAMKALSGGKKREVIFDENARQEYLTGFGKRKQERRKYGLAMEVLKKNKAHKDMVKDQRSAFKEGYMKNKELIDSINNNHNDTDGMDGNDDNSHTGIVNVYEDANTLSMFGSTVSVTVDTSFKLHDDDHYNHQIGSNDDDDDDGDNNSNDGDGDGDDGINSKNTNIKINNNNNSRNDKASMEYKPRNSDSKKELTKLEKALKIAKTKMGRQKKHRDLSQHGKARSASLNKKIESSKLLTKVIGGKHKMKIKSKHRHKS